MESNVETVLVVTETGGTETNGVTLAAFLSAGTVGS
jgi:hypothetical protein